MDNALYTFNVLGKKQGCAEYVAADPCRCEEIRTASNCCASCQDKGQCILRCINVSKYNCEAAVTITAQCFKITLKYVKFLVIECFCGE